MLLHVKEIQIWVPFFPENTLQITLANGLSLYSNSLASQEHDLFAHLRLTQLVIQNVTSNVSTDSNLIDMSIELTHLHRVKNMHMMHNAQRAYIKDQDQETRRCSIIYEEESADNYRLNQDSWAYFYLQDIATAPCSFKYASNFSQNGLFQWDYHRDALETPNYPIFEQMVTEMLYNRLSVVGGFPYIFSQISTSFTTLQLLREDFPKLTRRGEGEEGWSIVSLDQKMTYIAQLSCIDNSNRSVSITSMELSMHQPIIFPLLHLFNAFPSIVDSCVNEKSKLAFLIDWWHTSYVQLLVDRHSNSTAEVYFMLHIECLEFLFKLLQSKAMAHHHPITIGITAQQLRVIYQKSITSTSDIAINNPRNSIDTTTIEEEEEDDTPCQSNNSSLGSPSKIFVSWTIEMNTLKSFAQLPPILIAQNHYKNDVLPSGSIYTCHMDTPSFHMKTVSLLSGDASTWATGKIHKFLFNVTTHNIVPQTAHVLIKNVRKAIYFVDNLRQTLRKHQRLLQMIVLEVSKASSASDLVSDPIFLTRPSNIWRLGHRPFQDETGWRLLHHLRNHYEHLKRKSNHEWFVGQETFDSLDMGHHD